VRDLDGRDHKQKILPKEMTHNASLLNVLHILLFMFQHLLRKSKHFELQRISWRGHNSKLNYILL